MTDNASTPSDNKAALEAATARRLASYDMPGLGSIRADRSIPIKSRRHSVRHLAIR